MWPFKNDVSLRESFGPFILYDGPAPCAYCKRVDFRANMVFHEKVRLAYGIPHEHVWLHEECRCKAQHHVKCPLCRGKGEVFHSWVAQYTEKVFRAAAAKRGIVVPEPVVEEDTP